MAEFESAGRLLRLPDYQRLRDCVTLLVEQNELHSTGG